MKKLKNFFEGIKECLQEAIEWIMKIEKGPYSSKDFLPIVYYSLWRGLLVGVYAGLYEHYISHQNSFYAFLFMGGSTCIGLIIVFGIIPILYRWTVKNIKTLTQKTMKTKILIASILLLLVVASCSSYNEDDAKVLIRSKVPNCVAIVKTSGYEGALGQTKFYAAVDSAYIIHVFKVTPDGSVTEESSKKKE
jgi:hypothetical protein